MQSLGLHTYRQAMVKTDPVDPAAERRSTPDELARRVARYRERLIAEGRMNSVRRLDMAVAESGDNDRTRPMGSR